VAEPEKFLSLTALAKALGVNPQRLIALHDCKVITHDATSTQAFLFKESRLSELRAAVAKPFGLQKAIAHRKAQMEKTGK
jgi:hypothetical protein